MCKCRSHGGFPLFGLQGSHLNICYYHQDLHRRPLRPGSRPGFYGDRRALLLIGAWPLPRRLGIGHVLKRHPFSGLVDSADGPDGEPAGRRPEHDGAEARQDGACWVLRSRRRRLHGRNKGPGLDRHDDPRRSTPRAVPRIGSRRSTSDRGASPAPIRFPPDNFKHSLTLFSKSFSSFPRGTCSLSVSRPYLALDGIYRPIRAAFLNNPTGRQRLVVRPGPSMTGLSPSPAPLSRGLGLGPSLRMLLQNTIRTPRATDSQAGLFPVHSPILRESNDTGSHVTETGRRRGAMMRPHPLQRILDNTFTSRSARQVQWTSRDVAGSEPPTSPRSEHFTGPFNRINQVGFLRDVRPAWSSTHYLGRGEAITGREHRSCRGTKCTSYERTGPRPYAYEIFRIRKHDRASMHRRSRIMSIDTLGTPGTTEVHQAATRYATQDPYRTPWAQRPKGEDIEEECGSTVRCMKHGACQHTTISPLTCPLRTSSSIHTHRSTTHTTERFGRGAEETMSDGTPQPLGTIESEKRVNPQISRRKGNR
ncbi:hypothetical protein V6N13_027383 [Hibiscus sabdariffa]